ncbi:MAG TPA: dTDP-4-dehydrorhamnose reductase [Solirubrobacteraceae bacterium]|nr:dTDP-4-dehydrorhamnose reductase [Solirubrobacteraceae bacterium]
MRVLVPGAAGMLGSDLAAVAAARGHDVVALKRSELDVTDDAAVDEAVAVAAADVIINCAAFTDVDGAEADEVSAFAVNAHGAGNLARAASRSGTRLVHVSTDYVFDGTATAPYVESDRTDPRSAYGRTKLGGEHAVLATSTAHAVVRSAWLFGPSGRNFVATMLGLAGNGRREVAVVTDQVGCPTYTAHLAERLLDIAASGRGGVFHAAGSGQCSWNEFARAIFAAADVEIEVTDTTSETLGRPAQRPAWSVLASERSDVVLPSWQDGLSAYLSRNGGSAA